MVKSSNFHTLTSSTVFDARQNKPFLEYRRKWLEHPKKFIVGDFPIHLNIEATTRCNLHCPFCYVQFSKEKFTHGDIDLSTVKKILDEGSDNGLSAVNLSLRGEPLLHKDIAKMVRYAKKKNILDVFFNSNGMLLNEIMIGKLIDAGLDRISLSIEGYTEETYEKHRVGARFDNILKNLEKLIEIRKKRNVSHPKIRIVSVRFPKDTLANYKKFWLAYCDEISYLEYRDDSLNYKGLEYPWACPQLWQRLVILYDGTIFPCCYKAEKSMLLGNIKNISIKEAWKSKTLEIFRLLHKKGLSHKIPSCDNCSFRAMEIKKIKHERKRD